MGDGERLVRVVTKLKKVRGGMWNVLVVVVLGDDEDEDEEVVVVDVDDEEEDDEEEEEEEGPVGSAEGAARIDMVISRSSSLSTDTIRVVSLRARRLMTPVRRVDSSSHVARI